MSYSFLKSNAPFFPVGGSICLSINQVISSSSLPIFAFWFLFKMLRDFKLKIKSLSFFLSFFSWFSTNHVYLFKLISGKKENNFQQGDCLQKINYPDTTRFFHLWRDCCCCCCKGQLFYALLIFRHFSVKVISMSVF